MGGAPGGSSSIFVMRTGLYVGRCSSHDVSKTHCGCHINEKTYASKTSGMLGEVGVGRYCRARRCEYCDVVPPTALAGAPRCERFTASVRFASVMKELTLLQDSLPPPQIAPLYSSALTDTPQGRKGRGRDVHTDRRRVHHSTASTHSRTASPAATPGSGSRSSSRSSRPL